MEFASYQVFMSKQIISAKSTCMGGDYLHKVQCLWLKGSVGTFYSQMVHVRTWKVNLMCDRSMNHRKHQSRVSKSPVTVDIQACCKMNQQIKHQCCTLLIITFPQITTVAMEQCHLTCFSLSYIGFIWGWKTLKSN